MSRRVQPERAWDGERGLRTGRTAFATGVVGAVGLVLWLVALALDPDEALRAWLTAWTYGLSLALGALCLVMIAYVSDARWFVVARRVAEAMPLALPALAVGALPVLLGMEALYPWARPAEQLSEPLRDHLSKIDGWLDPSFFTARTVLYFAVWIALAAMLWRGSVAADPPGGEASERTERPGAPVAVSAAGLIVFGFTVTFAAFDWLMSTTPDWASTIFGIYYFAGCMVAALAALVVLTRALEGAGVLQGVVASSHYYALGRLLLAFVVFWAYIAYAQGFLMWIADIPAEVEWYLARWGGGWAWLLGGLALAHFLVPFLVLLNHAIKLRGRALSWVAGWLLAMHWVDLYWLVGPAPDGSGALPGWQQLPALAAVLGLGASLAAWRLGGRPATPRGDPAFASSLGYDPR